MEVNFASLPRYLKNLGLYRGLVCYLNVEFLNRNVFRIPDYKTPLYLRPNTTDKKVFREIFLFNAYGFNMNRSPRFIVDAGANTGLSSVFLANRYPNATICAIEPEQTNFEQLKKNISGYPNVLPLNAALWHRESHLKITNENDDHWAFTVEECQPGEVASFPAVSITSIMQTCNVNQIDLLKIDIEGAEREIFSENCDYWISRTKTIIIELHDWLKPGSSSSFFKAIGRYNITTRIHEGMLLIEINN